MKYLTHELINNIIADFKIWKNEEQELNKDLPLKDSVIHTLSVFNLSSLEDSETARATLKNTLRLDNEIQCTAIRLRWFVASCMLKYGTEAMTEYKELCCTVMRTVYGLSNSTINEISKVNENFWVCPMFAII